jgi:hypothetical protein
MHLLHLLSDVVGGAAVMNAVPHVVSGALGRKFPSPFAKPPGRGLSSAIVNMAWGLANLALGYGLLGPIGAFEGGDIRQVLAAALGVLLLGVFHAKHFGDLNGGRGPG